MFKKFSPALLLVALCALTLPATVFAQEEKADEKAAGQAADIGKFEGDANDAAALRDYAVEVFGEIDRLLKSKEADAAAAKLDALDEFNNGLELTDEAAKSTQNRIQSTVRFFRRQVEAARVSLDDLEKQLKEEPTAKGVQMYAMKLGRELSHMASSDPAQAEKELADAKSFLDELAENSASDDTVKGTIRAVGRMFAQLEQQIASERKLAELIGKEAPPLGVKEWVNGEALTEDDLEGKVVLLDFWAVWCGPCIATFPNLREWHEKYADKGLVIIGLTRYYNMVWDEEAERAKRSTDEVSPEEEQAMLAKFAEAYDLEHRFGIQEDRTLSEFYAVTGIPHVVLIDREGKVRMVKVGAGQSNAEEIGAMIEELISG